MPNIDPYTTRHIGVRDEYKPVFGRQVLTMWSGAFASDYDGHAVELPKHNGYMLSVGKYNPRKVRVECESPRTAENWLRVDAAIQAAFTAAEVARAHEDIHSVELAGE